MSRTQQARLPILVLAGFLGSGTTILLNRLLRDGPRAAVLINESRHRARGPSAH